MNWRLLYGHWLGARARRLRIKASSLEARAETFFNAINGGRKK